MNSLTTPRRSGRSFRCNAAALALSAACGVAGAQSPTELQPVPTAAPALPVVSTPTSAAGTDLKVNVRDVTTQGQLIRVPVNKSVLVDFSAPVKEVRLAKPDFAAVNPISPTQILVTGKEFGTTQLIVWYDENNQHVFDVAVDIELERLLASIRTAVPRARVQAYALLDSVVLTGEVPSAEAAERVMQIAAVFSGRVINHMRVAGVQQVVLRCTVAEVNRSATRQLGFNGWLGGDDFPSAFFASNLDNINPSNIGAPAGAAFSGSATVPFVVGEGGIPVTGATTLTVGFPQVQMQVFVRALRENGLLRILAEPNLVALNGQDATFLAGGEIPIPIATSDRINIEFKEFGVRLNFTPAVLGEDKVRIKVAPEISEPDFANAVTVSGFSIPGFSTRRVQTVVEIPSGQTFAIGGLLNDRVRAVSRAVPGLGDAPVIGALFRSVEFQSDQTELVVLVTPELVEPVSSDQVTSVPGQGYTEPNDFELFLMGSVDGKSGRAIPELQPRVNQGWPVRPSELYGPSSLPKVRGPVGPSSGEEGS